MDSVSSEDILEKLAKFALNTKWEDLPSFVIHETKRLILDSIGCAFAGLTVDPGKMFVSLAKRMGGPPESTIFGVNGKVSLLSAVLANGQLINATDYDAFTAAPHSPPYIVPPPLNTAEITGSSGKEVILATAIGFEIASRVYRACQTSPSERSPRPLERQGYAAFNFGVAASVGRLLGLDEERMKNALSISGHAVQPLVWLHHGFFKIGHYLKYGLPGWQSTGGVMAALLAEMGFIGDPDVFNAKHGFWKFCGYPNWNPEKIMQDLGKRWIFVENLCYKPYITCSVFMSALDAFSDIIRENKLSPEDITSVKVSVSKDVGVDERETFFMSRDIRTVVDAQFSIPYNISVIAYGIPVGPMWQNKQIMKDQRIHEFMKKVTVVPELEEPDAFFRKRVEVMAKGKTFIEDRIKPKKGGMSPGDPQMTDEELEMKYRHNASWVLTEDKIEKSISLLWNLENLKSISELMDHLTL
ncbi:MAG: MmgE/PrpD family protein [Candidatus Bathyarchaeia archaeon]